MYSTKTYYYDVFNTAKFFFVFRLLENLNEVIDAYPLLEDSPFLLVYESFIVNVKSIPNTPHYVSTSDSLVTNGPVSSNVSISLSRDLETVLENNETTRVVFIVYAIEAAFVEREQYTIANNRTELALGSTVASAKVSGVVVSGIENVVTLTFAKNQMVRGQ